MAAASIRFVGANGFCGSSYATLLRALGGCSTALPRLVRSIDVPLAAAQLTPWELGGGVTLEVSPHGRAAGAAAAAAAGTSLRSWQPMVAELVAATTAQVAADGNRRVVGVGHSFGGALLCAAGAAAPHLFERLVLLDPPLFAPAKRLAMGVAQASGLMGLAFPPASRAARKTASYESRATAIAALSKRSFFTDLDAACTADFFAHALVNCSGSSSGSSVCLAFPPSLEAAIYRTTPVDLAPFVMAPALISGVYLCRVPTVCIFAAPRSRLANSVDVAWLRRAMPSPAWQFITHSGEHFWPLHQPAAAAAFIRDLLLSGRLS